MKNDACRITLSIAALSAAMIATTAHPVATDACSASFVDPTAVRDDGNVVIGQCVYVGPFATLLTAAGHRIEIGNGTNVQDSVTLEATKADIILGDHVILAHGATIKGYATIGEGGSCNAGAMCPSFVGFNAEVDGGFVEQGAMVLHLARVGPLVTIRAGNKVLPGKNVTTQAEADDPALGKVAEVTEADRLFMEGVIHVNQEFAEAYHALERTNPNDVRGIGRAPLTSFNNGFRPRLVCPDGGGDDDDNTTSTTVECPTRDPTFRNRIIGNVRLGHEAATLDAVMGSKISLRSDEGEHFAVGTIDFMDSRVTFHALEHTKIRLGNNGRYHYRSLVHGGPNSFNRDTTQTGDGVQLGAHSVFFNSRVGSNSHVGFKSAVLGSDFSSRSVRVPDCKVVSAGVIVGDVEWCY